MLNKFIILFEIALVVALCFSCSVKGLFSHQRITEKEDRTLLKVAKQEEDICLRKYADSCKVLVTNGKQLYRCLKNKKKVIIYVWSAFCNSPACYPLDRLQVLADSTDADFYVVADYYDTEYMQVYYNIENPIIGIDTRYYKANVKGRYLKKFLRDMKIPVNTWKRIILLEDGEFKMASQYIEDLEGNSEQ